MANSAQHHILSVLVENKFGVLSRVAGLFSRRGYNIFSLAVSPTEDERLSRGQVSRRIRQLAWHAKRVFWELKDQLESPGTSTSRQTAR